jgi:hypothetical protein
MERSQLERSTTSLSQPVSTRIGTQDGSKNKIMKIAVLVIAAKKKKINILKIAAK